MYRMDFLYLTNIYENPHAKFVINSRYWLI